MLRPRDRRSIPQWVFRSLVAISCVEMVLVGQFAPNISGRFRNRRVKCGR